MGYSHLPWNSLLSCIIRYLGLEGLPVKSWPPCLMSQATDLSLASTVLPQAFVH